MPKHQPSRYRVAADIGGTFTDVAAFDEKLGRFTLAKRSPRHVTWSMAS